MPSYTVEALAQRLRGDVRGERSRQLSGAAAFEKAGPDEVTFAGDDKYLRRLSESQAGACLIARSAAADLPSGLPTCILVDDPLDAFLAVLKEFRPQRPRPTLGIAPGAYVSPTALVGEGTTIYPGAYVDDGAVVGARCLLYPGVFVGSDSRIGDDCVLHPHAVLYPDAVLGARVVVHAHAVLGADGFGYRFRNGRFEKIPQLGFVQLGDDCEIGACTTIDRGMIGPTVLGEGTKLDNLVMIGHNCELGKHNAYAAQVGLAGSVTTGDFVRCAGQVGIRDHVHLGRGTLLLAKAGVHKDVPDGEVHVGTPAGPEAEQIRIHMSLGKVPEMRKRLRELEDAVQALIEQVRQLKGPDLRAKAG